MLFSFTKYYNIENFNKNYYEKKTVTTHISVIINFEY